MHRTRSTAVLGAIASIVLLLAACSSGTTASSQPAAASGGGGGGETVSMANTQFTPSTLTISAGTTVTFTDTAGHTVTEGENGTAVADPIVDEQGGSDIDVTFPDAGTYHITCKIHSSMNMTITVEG